MAARGHRLGRAESPENQEAMLEQILRDSQLDPCSADGNGVLCDNYAQFNIDCDGEHRVCVIHREVFEIELFCFACFARFDRAARRIQRWYKRCAERQRLRRAIQMRKKAASIVISVLKMARAKRILRDLRRKRARENFLKRFE